MHITLIHNAEAGVKQSSKKDLLGLLQRYGYKVTYCSYKDDDYAAALHNPGDMVVIAGGDGTVQKVIQYLVGRNIPVAILPLGTANNIAKSLDITGTPQELIAGWTSGIQKKVDAGVIKSPAGEKYFFESVGFGLFCQLMQAHKEGNKEEVSSESRQDEFDQALQQLQDMLISYEAHRCRLKLDDTVLSGKYLLIEAMNMKAIGPRMAMAPDADPGDGLLDVILIAEEDRHVLAEYLSRRLSGNEHKVQLPVYRTKELEIIGENEIFHVDDNILDKKTADSVHIILKPHQLLFMVNT